jgi:hypothetical protein
VVLRGPAEARRNEPELVFLARIGELTGEEEAKVAK